MTACNNCKWFRVRPNTMRGDYPPEIEDCMHPDNWPMLFDHRTGQMKSAGRPRCTPYGINQGDCPWFGRG